MPVIESMSFDGLLRNTEFADLTHTELINALRRNGWVEHSDNRGKYDDSGKRVGTLTRKSGGHVHFVQQLMKDGPTVGINTPGQFAVAMRCGTTEQGRDSRLLRYIPSRRACVVFQPDEGWLITFTHA